MVKVSCLALGIASMYYIALAQGPSIATGADLANEGGQVTCDATTTGYYNCSGDENCTGDYFIYWNDGSQPPNVAGKQGNNEACENPDCTSTCDEDSVECENS